jgi:hypothetical protein
MSSLLQHAKSELRRAGLYDADADFDGDIAVQVENLVQTFVAYGHSGGSSDLTLEYFNRVINHKPITPLTGEDDEWTDVEEYQPGQPLWQNKRDSRVFKDDKGRAWIITDKGTMTYITFPYSTP